MSLDFSGMFAAQADGEKRVWAHDRSLTIGASEAFQCLRRNYFMKRGTPPDADHTESYGATTRGSLLEAHYVVPVLRGQLPKDSVLLWAGDDQVTLLKDRISATPDGLATGLTRDALAIYGIHDILSDSVLIEIKSFDPRLKLEEPKPVHAGQVQQQLGLVHETTNHRPEYAVIIYVNASWLDDVRVFVVKRDPAIYEVCKKRADMVYDATDPKTLAPEGKIRGGSECDYCPFFRSCAKVQTGAVPTERLDIQFMPADDVILTTLTKRARETQEKIVALTMVKDATAEEIKEFLKKHKTRFAKTKNGYTASLAVAAGRTTYDLDKLFQDTGVDREDYAIVGEASERLTVKSPSVKARKE